MKSIKEKSEEFSFMEEGTDLNGMPYKDYNSYKMDGFEKGANYVLEEIEKVIRSNSSCERAIFELGKLVIQLKK